MNPVVWILKWHRVFVTDRKEIAGFNHIILILSPPCLQNDLLTLKVTSQLHHLSIKCAIHVLHANKFNPNCLRRRPGEEVRKNCLRLCCIQTCLMFQISPFYELKYVNSLY